MPKRTSWPSMPLARIASTCRRIAVTLCPVRAEPVEAPCLLLGREKLPFDKLRANGRFPIAAQRTRGLWSGGEVILKLDKLRNLRLDRELDRHWVTWMLAVWAGVAAWYLWQRQGNIYWLVLGDTDDNMRLMQVRALLAGQGWYDLRQYRLDPALGGFDIHWSRFVDLPIAGLILLLKPFIGVAAAEKWACGIAPLLPLGLTMTGLALIVRRLIAPQAWALALPLLLCCVSTMLMYAPMRVDHHGWQLACLALTVAG